MRCFRSGGTSATRFRVLSGVGSEAGGRGPPVTRPVRLPAWQRLSVRTVGLLVGVTLLAIGVVGTLIYQHQKRDLQATLGTLLLNIARTGALLVEPALHAEVERTLSQDSDAYVRVRAGRYPG